MGTISSPGLSSLYQALSNSSPTLASPSVKSALENAPATDVAEISVAATQLEGVDELFGISNSTSSDPANQLSGILANLQGSSASQTSGSQTGSAITAASALSPAQQLADWQSATHGEALNSLFGGASSVPNIVNVLG